MYIRYRLDYSVFIVCAMLNTEGMLHIAFNGAVYKKSQSGLLTRGNAIRQKGKIFSTFSVG